MRNLKTLAFAGLIGVLGLASDASACHKMKCACPAPVVAYAPAPVVACAPAKKCGMPKLPKLPKMGCHKKAVTSCAPVAYAAPATYAAPVYAAPQASGQGM